MKKLIHFIGIDVSKETLDLTLIRNNDAGTIIQKIFANSLSGPNKWRYRGPKTNMYQVEHNELFAYLNTLTEEELDKRGPALSMGELSVIEFLHRSSEHEHEHAAEIKQAIGA